MPQQDLLTTDQIEQGRQKINAQTQELYGTFGSSGSVASVADLKALTPSDGWVRQTLGYYAAQDGGGGAPWRFYLGDSTAVNGGSVVADNGNTGRWKRPLGDRVFAREFGVAPGVGTNNTTSMNAALLAASGRELVLPDGIIEFTPPLAPPSGKTKITGSARYEYSDYVNDLNVRDPVLTGTMLQPLSGTHGAVFSTIGGIKWLDGINFRQPATYTIDDGLLPIGEIADHLQVTNCRFETMHHIADAPAHAGWGGWKFFNNFVVGVSVPFRGQIVDMTYGHNTFVSNQDCFVIQGGGANTWYGNRIEWCDRFFDFSSASINNVITGNIIDGCWEAPVKIRDTAMVVVSGNSFHINGRENSAAGKRSHIYLTGTSPRAVIVGNWINAGADAGPLVPAYLMEFDSASGGQVEWKGNFGTGYRAAPVLDTDTDSAGILNADEFHIYTGVGSPGTASDTLRTMLRDIQRVLRAPASVFIYDNRRVVGQGGVGGNIDLIGIGATAPTLTNEGTGYMSCRTMTNVNYGGRTFNTYYGDQLVSGNTPISTTGASGVWGPGKTFWYAGAVAAGKQACRVVDLTGTTMTFHEFGAS